MEIIKNNLITIIVMIILIYLCLIKNKTNNKNIYVLLRIKNENLDEINKCLNSYRKQKFKNKKLIILNHFDNLNEFVINYCNKYNDTTLYSSSDINPYSLKIILNDLNIKLNQIIVPIDSNDYFNDNNILLNIINNKIQSNNKKDFKNNKIQYFYYRK